ncbi:MAG: SAM-dependent chlorinase/fluorinase [Gammaproteobacteria bacterium]|nr:SAM-dependent chlorinase/fluorinase [Gammaproteobacteria bacterium]
MIALFTDFGLTDPYVGQMHAVLALQAPGTPVIDLFHGLPDFNVRVASYLLPAYTRNFPLDTIFVCVVDPGVGSPRKPLIMHVNGCWYVGPDNGLFRVLWRQFPQAKIFEIAWRPNYLSSSFHGRDLFAPVAAMLARGQAVASKPCGLSDHHDWPPDSPEIVYIDHYGSVITGLRGNGRSKESVITIGNHKISYARVYSEANTHQPFWHENSNGLIEIAINQGRAASFLKVNVGDQFEITT